MENRITKKVDTYCMRFKQDIKEWIETNKNLKDQTDIKSEFLQFIFDYDSINMSKEDFSKRKRVKNIVPNQLRCCAKRANGEQCTRRKKDDLEFCGTHIKGTPYGKLDYDVNEPTLAKKKETWVQEIQGIQSFIDEDGNVYDPGEILRNKVNPTVIARYDKKGDSYSISEYKS